MLSTELVHEIHRLVRTGELSQRKIAARLGVSHGIVGAIANGRRELTGKEQSDDASGARASGRRPMRCPCCGYRVYMPCRICITREYRQQQLAGIKPASNRVERRKRRRRRACRAD